MFTTSRYCSRETRGFARKLAGYVARGKKTVRDLVALARRRGEQSIFIVEEKDEHPYRIIEIKVLETGDWAWAGERLLTASSEGLS